jgi:hypothetical protein
MRPSDARVATEVRISAISRDVGTLDDEPFDDEPFDDEPFDDEPFDDEPFDDEPFDDEPFDDEPFDDEPFDDEPFDDEPFDDEPFDDEFFDEAPVADHAARSIACVVPSSRVTIGPLANPRWRRTTSSSRCMRAMLGGIALARRTFAGLVGPIAVTVVEDAFDSATSFALSFQGAKATTRSLPTRNVAMFCDDSPIASCLTIARAVYRSCFGGSYQANPSGVAPSLSAAGRSIASTAGARVVSPTTTADPTSDESDDIAGRVCRIA